MTNCRAAFTRTARVVVLLLVVSAGFVSVRARAPRNSSQSQDPIAALAADRSIRRALDLARESEPQTIADQIRFCETAAPPFREGARAELLKQAFLDAGLSTISLDRAGNVIGFRPGTSVRPRVMLAAHLDTVFPEGTSVVVRRTGQSLAGPGIGDNCRGLAVLVAVARALRDTRVQTPGSVMFVANVGEEGLGDLRGMREIFGVARGRTLPPPEVDFFVSIDGPGLHVTNVAVGSRRYRVAFKGPGGHSYAAFGLPSPVAALSRAVTKIGAIDVPAQPRTTFNVGRIGGGASINAIPSDAWMEVDLRSSSPSALNTLDAKFKAAVDAAVREENARWPGPSSVTATREVVGERPAGMTSLSSAIVRTALGAGRALGLTVGLGEGSTDANIPISLGIPAITIGGGGTGLDAHALTESFDPTDAWQGTQHALLIAVALAQK